MSASQQLADGADRFLGRIRAATNQLVEAEANIQSLQNAYTALTQLKKDAIIANLVARGHTQAELTAYYTQLIQIKSQINTLLVARFDAAEI